MRLPCLALASSSYLRDNPIKFVNDMIETANLALNNSGIGNNLRFRNAGVSQINYTEGNTINLTIDDLLINNKIQAMKSFREFNGADIGVLLSGNGTQSTCGLAPVGPRADRAFAVVGVVSPCDNEVNNHFIHEIGHIFGAAHDPANAKVKPVFSFGYAYQGIPDLNIPGSYQKCVYSIMAYPCSLAFSYERKNYFSNPNTFFITDIGVRYPFGTTSTNDNARLIREQAPLVASFRMKPPIVARLPRNVIYVSATGPGSDPNNRRWLRSVITDAETVKLEYNCTGGDTGAKKFPIGWQTYGSTQIQPVYEYADDLKNAGYYGYYFCQWRSTSKTGATGVATDNFGILITNKPPLPVSNKEII